MVAVSKSGFDGLTVNARYGPNDLIRAWGVSEDPVMSLR
jgi:hypothetical protein